MGTAHIARLHETFMKRKCFGKNLRFVASNLLKRPLITRKPLLSKLSPNVTDIAEIARAVEAGYPPDRFQ